MKKNLISVLILALLVVNLVLTGILTITILPQTKKSNELITAICSAINLELSSGEQEGVNSIPMSQIETYSVPDAMTINLKAEPGSSDTYFVKLSVSVSMDSEHDDYKEYGEEISTRESIIKDTINTVISQYTVTEFEADRQAVKDDILDELQRQFGSDFIIAVNFSEVTVMAQ